MRSMCPYCATPIHVKVFRRVLKAHQRPTGEKEWVPRVPAHTMEPSIGADGDIPGGFRDVYEWCPGSLVRHDH